MIIAFTYEKESKRVGQHFGDTEYFYLINTETNERKEIDNGGYSHKELIPYLSSFDVNLLICGGIGDMAVMLLNNEHINVIPGIDLTVDEAYDKYMSGKLVGNDKVIHKCGCH